MQSLRFPRFYHYKNVRIGDFVLRQKLFRQLCTAHILKNKTNSIKCLGISITISAEPDSTFLNPA